MSSGSGRSSRTGPRPTTIEVVGFASDLDVNGSVDPFDTPQLGDWLGDRTPEFDVIDCWKLDRLSRNATKLNKLFGWSPWRN